MKKQNKKTATATATVKAQSVALDVQNNNRWRKTEEARGVDSFALHAFKRASKAYADACAAYAVNGKTFAKADGWLVCGGVANLVETREKGFYARLSGSKTVFGNVDLLSTLYGKDARFFTKEEVNSATGEVATIRKNKVDFSGIVFAKYDDKITLAVKQSNGSNALVTGELGRNSLQTVDVRASLIRG